MKKESAFTLVDGSTQYKLDYFPRRGMFYDLWEKCRNCIDGEEAVKHHAEKYLTVTPLMKRMPEFKKEYFQRASYFNASGRTADGMKGLLFKDSPTMTVPDAIINSIMYFSNLNETAEDFAKRLTDEQIKTNLNLILVDYPQTEGRQLTVAEAERLGLAPYATLYPAESIIDIKYNIKASKTSLSMVIVHEPMAMDINEFERETVQTIRVLDIDEMGAYRQRIYMQDKMDAKKYVKSGDDIYPTINGQKLSYIPAVPVSGNGVGFQLVKPILNDICNINLKLFQNSADYELSIHEVCNPTPVFKGLAQDPDTGEKSTPSLGVAGYGVHLDPEGDAFYMQATGAGIELIKEAMDDKKSEMALMGGRIIAPEKRVAETAQTAEIHRAGENAILSDMADTISSAMEETLYFMALWLGIPEQQANEIVYRINKNYLASLTPADAKILAEIMVMGGITAKEHFELMQKGGIIRSDKTFDEHSEEKANEIPQGLNLQ